METRVFGNRWAACLVALFGVSLINPAMVQAREIYVDARIDAPGTGQSWATAFSDLQQALKSARHRDEIRIAQGMYRPTEPVSSGGGGGRAIDLAPRDWSFQIRYSITIQGGYAGISEPDPNTRDLQRFTTILSGDHLGNDHLGRDSDRLAGNPWQGENSLVILSVAWAMDTATTLDGLVVQGATACACRVNGGRLVVQDCVFRDNANVGDMQGAGAICSSSCDLVLDRCTFTQNYGLQGGAVFVEEGNLVLRSCWFQGNVASVEGGALFQKSGTGYLQDSTFIRNESQGPSGVLSTGTGKGTSGVYTTESFVVDRCRFLGNAAYEDSICSFQGQQGRLDNCLFSGNLIVGQGAILHSEGGRVTGTGLTLANNWAPSVQGQDFGFNNCIFWDEQFHTSASSGHGEMPFGNIVLEYCNVFLPWTGDGQGNISEDPKFMDPLGPDGAAGTVDDDFRLQTDSPCINTGSNRAVSQNVFDLDGQPRINHLVDMGAYETWQVWHVDGATGYGGSPGRTADKALRSIQEAIDKAHDGDSILVHSGYYAEDINFRGKAVLVKGLVGSTGVPVLTMDRGSTGHGGWGYVPSIVFDSNEGPDTVLEHFVISGLDTAITLSHSSPTLRHLTLVNNKIGIQASGMSDPVIEHCIFWRNSDEDLTGTSPRYSCIQRAEQASGPGNLSQNPIFADPNGGDYHLQSSGGRYSPDHATWMIDRQTSPCISAGDPNTPLGEQPLSYSSTVNMGAYGGTIQASHLPRVAPIISFLALHEGDEVSSNESFEIEAWDIDGDILAIEFLRNGQRLGMAAEGREGGDWAWSLSGVPVGPAAFTARATDNHGLVGQVTIHVTVRPATGR
ncbi:MAG: hypothetical protein K9N55_20765 [Phycisphaerae bacterium]|nr:hypothetical protein [Phycisphaerae bacterium]